MEYTDMDFTFDSYYPQRFGDVFEGIMGEHNLKAEITTEEI